MFGLIKSGIKSSAFTLFGVYLAQNYKLPDVGATVGALVWHLHWLAYAYLRYTQPYLTGTRVVQYRTATEEVEQKKK